MTAPTQNTKPAEEIDALWALVWNRKGGVGKSMFSMSSALEGGRFVITNDLHSPIDQTLGQDRAKRLMPDEALPSVPRTIPLTFDFGGTADSRVIDAAKVADVVIIPAIYGSAYDMQVTINAIKEIQEYNSNIIIIANKCKRGDYQRIKSVLDQFYSYPVLELKDSKAFAEVIESKLSISQIITKKPWLGYHYSRPLAQIKHIMAVAHQYADIPLSNAA